MNRRVLFFIAIAITMLFGLGFVVWDPRPDNYAVIGGVLIGLMWLALTMFARQGQRDGQSHDDRP